MPLLLKSQYYIFTLSEPCSGLLWPYRYERSWSVHVKVDIPLRNNLCLRLWVNRSNDNDLRRRHIWRHVDLSHSNTCQPASHNAEYYFESIAQMTTILRKRHIWCHVDLRLDNAWQSASFNTYVPFESVIQIIAILSHTRRDRLQYNLI